jgi:hypothetical protein
MSIEGKARATRSVMIKTGFGLADISKRYDRKKFVDGFPKMEVISQVLTGCPSKRVADYLTRRLSGSQYDHMRDRRTPLEYGCDLVLGWGMEDCIVDFLPRFGVEIDLVGCDSDREFLGRFEVSTDSDAEVGFGGVSRKLELVFDQTGYWSRNGSAEFRDSKFEKIKNEGFLVLGVSVLDATGFVYDSESPLSPKARYIKKHAPWNKPAYSIGNMRDVLVPLEDIPDLVKRILSSLEREEVST